MELTPPLFHDVRLMYPLDGDDLAHMEARYQEVVDQFARLYHGVLPSFFARAPGRVNLIGEHVDYSGYGVLPMALDRQDTVMAVHVADAGDDATEDTIILNNLHNRWPQRTITASSSLDIDHDWSRYVLASYKGLQQAQALIGSDGKENQSEQRPRIFSILVHGTVPIGSGLSSSSALVCASTLAFANANKQHFSKSQLATLTCKAERLIGLESGGMDQAIAFLAEQGKAKKIDFDPIRSVDVTLPRGVAFVIANSMVESNKYVTAQSGYNMRVVECRLGAAILAKRLGIANWDKVRRLIDVQKMYQDSASGHEPTFEELLLHVKEYLHEEPYCLQEIAEVLAIDIEEVRANYLGRIIADDPKAPLFYLFARSYHVYAEEKRVEDFANVCRTQAPSDDEVTGQLQELGRLMNESHFSCRDFFDCSCPELDALTALCRESGAYGSRLTGAGWGGWTVSLVPSHKLHSFCETVKRQFPDLLVTKPGTGAACYIPLSKN